MLSGILGGIHWRAALPDTWRDPLAGGMLSRVLGGIHWRALASSSGGILGGIHWPASLAGSTGEPLWRDTRRDPLASRSGGILSGIYWQAALAGYSALWRDTGRDPLASSSGGILGRIHWRAALAGYWVGLWCRSIANADSNVKSNNPFLSGGDKLKVTIEPCTYSNKQATKGISGCWVSSSGPGNH